MNPSLLFAVNSGQEALPFVDSIVLRLDGSPSENHTSPGSVYFDPKDMIIMQFVLIIDIRLQHGYSNHLRYFGPKRNN